MLFANGINFLIAPLYTNNILKLYYYHFNLTNYYKMKSSRNFKKLYGEELFLMKKLFFETHVYVFV